MDPLSLTASLVTVLKLIAASSIKIRDLRGKFKNAPKDAESLLEKIQTFEILLKELTLQLRDPQNSAPPQETLQQKWGSSLAQMERDLQSFQAVLSKVEPLLEKKTKSSRIELLARQMFSETEVEKHQRKIDGHCSAVANIQAMVCRRELGKVLDKIIQLVDEDRAAFRTLSSQISQSTSHLDSKLRDGFSAVSSQVAVSELSNQARHETILVHLEDHAEKHTHSAEKVHEVFEQPAKSMDINEEGFQAVHSRMINAASSNLEEHNITHAMLAQCQGQLQRIIRENVAFGTVERGAHLASTKPRESNSVITKTAVFWNTNSHRMPIGTLWISMEQSRHTNSSRRSISQVCTKSKISVQFVPPLWLSQVAIRYSMKLSCDLISHDWRWGATLRPLTVSNSSFFIEAVKRLDTEGVRRSFAEGLARPTDYIEVDDGDLLPWFECLGNALNCGGGWFEDKVARYVSMLRLLADDGLPGRDSLLTGIINDMGLKRIHNREHQRCYSQIFSSHADIIWTRESNVIYDICYYHDLPIRWIPKLFLHTSEPWLIDDLGPLQNCLIGTLAHGDPIFCGHLKEALTCFRSCASPVREIFAENLFETTFGIDSIDMHFQTLLPFEMSRLLSLLCRTASASMVKIFVDFGVDVNGSGCCDNLLGHAAAGGNIDVIHMLLEAGANSSLSIWAFLGNCSLLSDATFQQVLPLLVENGRPTSTDPEEDPFLAIIESSKAVRFFPQVLEHIVNRNFLNKRHLGDDADPICYCHSYMFQAIRRKSPAVVDFLLRNGAHANVQILRPFKCYGHWFRSSTWITFSVMCGAASCSDVLIKHGLDVTALDGVGMSALQLARKNVLESHPRDIRPLFFHGKVTADEDAETLAVVERAFNQKYMGTKSLEDYYSHVTGEVASQISSQRHTALSALKKTLEKALENLLTPTQIEYLRTRLRRPCSDIQELWSLSSPQALLMRFIYVLSYALLLVIELYAIITGYKRIPMPSRSHLSALAILALALIWGASQLGVS